MKKIFIILLFLIMTSCDFEGNYTGDVVVTGKKYSTVGNAFHTRDIYYFYGKINERDVRWEVPEFEYEKTDIGDTISLYDQYYVIVND